LALEEARAKEERRKAEDERVRNEIERIRQEEERMRKQVEEDVRRQQEEIRKQAEERTRQMLAAKLNELTGETIPVENLAKRYSKNRTDEQIFLNLIVIRRTVINRDGEITFYSKVEHDNGATYYFRNGETISAWQYKYELNN